jgi:hypothetical protein
VSGDDRVDRVDRVDIRVERGSPDEYELAALSVALMYALRRERTSLAVASPVRAAWDSGDFVPPGTWPEGPGIP